MGRHEESKVGSVWRHASSMGIQRLVADGISTRLALAYLVYWWNPSQGSCQVNQRLIHDCLRSKIGYVGAFKDHANTSLLATKNSLIGRLLPNGRNARSTNGSIFLNGSVS
ncbi:uncharacterized protein ATNIH1004_000215 [Aspergillus tanneri]|uniref:Uncharacterized protein n=1 Tax=Aspergillus tanneri TaxID=1220188 RepID=A0A5M9N2C9_9EURO|nr:uncharacterized protein ATNIH1004_000215 [Aspergillus tanneri]KAA8651333.1 hypothetical protein ATNIH1004_000215 [Aspergillus tanneri]